MRKHDKFDEGRGGNYILKDKNDPHYDPYYDDVIDEQYDLTQASSDELDEISKTNIRFVRNVYDWCERVTNSIKITNKRDYKLFHDTRNNTSYDDEL